MKPCPVFLANISFPYDSAQVAGLERVIFFPPRVPGEVSPRFDRYSGVFCVLWSNLSLQISFVSHAFRLTICRISKYIQHCVVYYCRILSFTIHIRLFSRFSFFRNCVLNARVVYCMKIMGWNFIFSEIHPELRRDLHKNRPNTGFLFKGEQGERLNQKRG